MLKKILLAYFFLLLGGLLLLFLAHLIPSQTLQTSIGGSVSLLKNEGTYPSFGLPFRKIVLDNYTDALMLNTAVSVTGSPSRALILNNRYLANNQEIDQIRNLESTFAHTASVTSSYERYWHGYLILLRPMLVIFSYFWIRVILSIATLLLFGYLVYISYKKTAASKAIALVCAAVSVDFFFIGHSIQFSQVFLIGIVAAIIQTKWIKTFQNSLLLFFITGALTAYFDLLTAPLVSLGFLLVVSTNPQKFKQVIQRVAFWSMGYILFWSSKWVLAELLIGRGSFANAFHHVINRTVTQADENFSQVTAVLLNVKQLVGYDPTNKVFFLGVCLLAVLFFLVFRKRTFTKNTIRAIVTWGCIGLMPYAWYLLAANHSYLHVWYAYRAQFLSVAAAVLLYAELIDWAKFALFLAKYAPNRHSKR